MTKAENEYEEEMKRLCDAIDKTDSQYLKRDYGKKLKSMEAELKEYRFFLYGQAGD